MESALISPAKAAVLGIPGVILGFLIPLVAIAIFAYIITMRLAPLVHAAPDQRFNRIPERLYRIFKLWLLQYRHPRYRLAGVLHIMLFAGFIILGLRSAQMVMLGISEGFVPPGMDGVLGAIYNFIRSYAATWVLVAVVIAALRRLIIKPERYSVPPKYGKDHTLEALLVLGLIATLVTSESLFDGTLASAQAQKAMHVEFIPPLTAAWWFKILLRNSSIETLQNLHLAAYFIHDLAFFFFLCFLPLGKHFHVITSLFNVFFMRLDPGTVKPVKHGVEESQLDNLESFGVKKLEDFTWKHILDFYSCVDCGRCSDNCPANAVGRPLSPRFISIKGRNLTYENYPLYPPGTPFKASPELIGGIYEEDEIWSCTTCGACEEECPVTIEYIDKIIDLRRGMVDDGNVPQSLQKPLRALEKRGNPWGKMERKRADWTKELPEDMNVKVVGRKESADTLYFVDSITSYDDRMQDIARATAKILKAAEVDFGILGKDEKDSGHEVRRFGEEMLFMDLRDQNTEAIAESGAQSVVTADPHAYNALCKDYNGLPPVEHISEVMLRGIKDGRLNLQPVAGNGKIYTYHDPCYLGRHNDLYDTPREVLDAIPGLARIDMERCRDRSFCCGGGGLMLFYEPEEEQRMGVLRVKMAEAAGANVIVTACPFCLVNIEDAIKVAGLEGKLEAIDLSELVAQHLPADLTVEAPA